MKSKFPNSVGLKTVNILVAVILVVVISCNQYFDKDFVFAQNTPSILKWSYVNTPNSDGNVVIPSEINRLAIGPDNSVLYAVDIPNKKLFKSTNQGITWDNRITNRLTAAGAFLPIWDIKVAPDDVNFIVAVTDSTVVPSGPKNVFVSTDGGQNWQNTNWTGIDPVELISCLDISPQYDTGKRYIAIGTREVPGTTGTKGKVYTLKAPGPSAWISQTIAPSTNWAACDVITLEFSPSYKSDLTIIVVLANVNGLFLNIGSHDTVNNSTTWKPSGLGYPVKITSPGTNSPIHTQIITAKLGLPSDFSGGEPGSLRRYFVSFDAINAGQYFSGIFRIDNTTVILLMHTTSLSTSPIKRISSIAYWGTHDSGKLIAGETTTNPVRAMVDIWICLDPFTTSYLPGWKSSDILRSPTGGAFSGRANAFLLWSANGDTVLCGTSSANLALGGTSLLTGWWPGGLLTGVPLDESAFSVSRDDGTTWNQISLIDTQISKLTDVAVIQKPENNTEPDAHSVIYLASVNKVAGGFDSIWRSISDPLGEQWERITCTSTVNDDLILRINPRISDDKATRSNVIVFADRNTDNIRYSSDEGWHWQILYPGRPITDFNLASDTSIYLLSDTGVFKGISDSVTWKWSPGVSTGLTSGHTIITPLKNPSTNPTGKNNVIQDWVMVGSAMVGEAAWADFSQPSIKFLPSPNESKRTPVQGDIHIIPDEQFEINKTIYVACGKAGNGKIYRWVIGKSSGWEEIQPINNNFFGIEHKRGALYGAYNTPSLLGAPKGVDRTLYPKLTVPPPPEWDDLTADLPLTISFTREPSSLKASTNTDTNLWAIDDVDFIWDPTTNPPVRNGWLWNYTDTLVKNGPWTTAPASNDVIPIDPVSGTANEVNFAWRQLSYTDKYELQIAKDENFFMRVLVKDNKDSIKPSNPVAPGWVLFPGLLEPNHKYFWRVRASHASTGEEIRSPWSATMYFTTMAGTSVTAKHLGPTLLQPPNRCAVCSPSPSFSWSPMFQTTHYEFILARDAAFTQILEKTTTSTTAYQYKDKLDKGTYYWQVKSVKPMLGESSPVGSFTVADNISQSGTIFPDISDSTTQLIWIGIYIYLAFTLAMFALIIKTRYF